MRRLQRRPPKPGTEAQQVVSTSCHQPVPCRRDEECRDRDGSERVPDIHRQHLVRSRRQYLGPNGIHRLPYLVHELVVAFAAGEEPAYDGTGRRSAEHVRRRKRPQEP